ncbi:hypothetical protein PR048_013221 [Dryococelus australis]|uniref:Uncharacterized protein n=1 Tax=Dryococelus australis TaxID=614101 RepID=A0ABQ9HRN0_9NEOP|nr:hypothetical protein PR048_013221 [Dryococelus australis]
MLSLIYFLTAAPFYACDLAEDTIQIIRNFRENANSEFTKLFSKTATKVEKFNFQIKKPQTVDEQTLGCNILITFQTLLPADPIKLSEETLNEFQSLVVFYKNHLHETVDELQIELKFWHRTIARLDKDD